jgi:hypothetical protein
MARKTRRRFRKGSTRKRRIYGGKIVDITPTTLAEIPNQCITLLRGIIEQSSESDNTNTVNRDYIVIPGLTVNLETLGQRETDNNTVEYKVFYITRHVKKYFIQVSQFRGALPTLPTDTSMSKSFGYILNHRSMSKLVDYARNIDRNDYTGYQIIATIKLYQENESIRRLVDRIIAMPDSNTKKITKQIQTIQNNAVELRVNYTEAIRKKCDEWSIIFMQKNDEWRKNPHNDGEKLLYYSGMLLYAEYFILHYLEQKYKTCMLPPLIIDLTKRSARFGDTSFLPHSESDNIHWISLAGVKAFIDCILSGNKTISIISLGILYTHTSGERSGHANMLIYYHAKNIIEWFEPHGQFFQDAAYGDTYKKITEPVQHTVEELVKIVNEELSKRDRDPIQLIIPSIACPRVQGLQSSEDMFYLDSVTRSRLARSTGYCGIWAFMVAELSLSFPSLSLENIQELVLRLRERGVNLMHVMLGYLLTVYDAIDDSNIISTIFGNTYYYSNLKTMRDIDKVDHDKIRDINNLVWKFIGNTERVALTEKMPEMDHIQHQQPPPKQKQSLFGKVRSLIGR